MVAARSGGRRGNEVRPPLGGHSAHASSASRTDAPGLGRVDPKHSTLFLKLSAEKAFLERPASLASAPGRLRSMPRVLIVEDEPMVAMDLESTIKVIIAAEIVAAPSVSSAREAVAEPLDFAFLDIEVTDGKTFEIALREAFRATSDRTGSASRFRLAGC
jgi:hypothetical protein